MQLFLHNLGTLIPNLPHAKLYFVFFLLKIKKKKMVAKISENVTALHHGFAYNEHKNIKMAATARQCTITLLPSNVDMCFWCLHIGFSHPGNQFRAVITSMINILQSYGGKNKCCARKTTHRRPV